MSSSIGETGETGEIDDSLDRLISTIMALPYENRFVLTSGLTGEGASSTDEASVTVASDEALSLLPSLSSLEMEPTEEDDIFRISIGTVPAMA